MKRVLLSLFVLALMPAFASAGDRYRGYDSPRQRYSGGGHYSGGHYSGGHYSHGGGYYNGGSRWGFSFGYNSGYYPGYAYSRPYYYAPPVVVAPPPPVYVAPAPVVVEPYCYPRTYYYGGYNYGSYGGYGGYYPRSGYSFGFSYYGR